MKKYLILLMMAATVLASCSKDEIKEEQDYTISVITQEMVGTWEFQNPTAAEVVVEGSNKELVKSIKEEVTCLITDGRVIIPEVVTFKSDMTCTGTSTDKSGNIENSKGAYHVAKGYLSGTLTGSKPSAHTQHLDGRLKKEGNTIFLVIDKKTIVNGISEDLANTNITIPARITTEFKEMLANITTGITEISCPLKMVKQ